MRFTSVFVAALLALTSLVTAATSRGIVVSATPQVGNARPYFVGKAPAAAVIGQNDTLMIAATGSDTTGGSRNRYLPLKGAPFYGKMPSNYEYATSNKDSLILFVTQMRVDADTGDVNVTLQGRAYGDTATNPAAGTYVNIATAIMPNTAALGRQRVALPNPLGMDFRILLTGSTATDTTRVRRVEIYDK